MGGSIIYLVCVGILVGEVASIDVSRLNVKKFHTLRRPYQDTIVGGHNVTIEEYPHQVAFTFIVGTFQYFCAGFIVSEHHILTVGQCAYRINPEFIELKAGSACYAEGTLIPIAEVITHPEYNEDTLDNDVAILKTAQPIKFSETIKAVELPSKSSTVKDGSMLNVTGWGATEYKYLSSCLLGVEIPLLNFEECKKIYHEIELDLPESMFCAGYAEGGKDTCYGDTGGAVVHEGKAVGIVSHGWSCGEPGLSGMYTNITAPAVRDFITKHTGL